MRPRGYAAPPSMPTQPWRKRRSMMMQQLGCLRAWMRPQQLRSRNPVWRLVFLARPFLFLFCLSNESNSVERRYSMCGRGLKSTCPKSPYERCRCARGPTPNFVLRFGKRVYSVSKKLFRPANVFIHPCTVLRVVLLQRRLLENDKCDGHAASCELAAQCRREVDATLVNVAQDDPRPSPAPI
jgi:hypothetical protein